MWVCGVPSYINALPLVAPFYLGALKSDFTFYAAPPDVLNRADLAVSLVSTIHYLENKEQLTATPLGIGSRGKVQSVCFFYPENFTKVGLDPESATSNRVLQWLLKKEVHYTQERSEGFLLIGDKCLNFTPPPGYRKMDLGEEWMRATHLPLPFALLVAKKPWAEQNPEALQKLVEDLKRALAWSKEHRKEIVPLAQRQTALGAQEILSYWDHLEYVLDEPYQEALAFMEKNL